MSTATNLSAPAAGPAYAWPAALAAAALLGSLAAACMMPFVGVAVAAAATMTARRGAATVATAWAINQLLGFTLLGYPWTPYAVAWGAALGIASLAAFGIAHVALRGRKTLAVLPTLAAGALAFAAFEALLFGFALIAGGTDAFTPAIVLQILANDARWLAGLLALNILLTRAAPRLFGRPAALRLA